MRLLPDWCSLRIGDPCLNQRPGKQGAYRKGVEDRNRRGASRLLPLLVLQLTRDLFRLNLAHVCDNAPTSLKVWGVTRDAAAVPTPALGVF